MCPPTSAGVRWYARAIVTQLVTQPSLSESSTGLSVNGESSGRGHQSGTTLMPAAHTFPCGKNAATVARWRPRDPTFTSRSPVCHRDQNHWT